MPRKRLIKSYRKYDRKYEFVSILSQELSLDSAKEKMEEIKAIATSFGGYIKLAALTNLKSYAYAINTPNNKKGYYCCIYLTIKPENVMEMKNKVSIQNHVLRTFIVLTHKDKQNNNIFSSNYEDDTHRNKKKLISYDDPNTLFKFLGERSKIEPKKQSLGRNIAKGVSLRQRKISKEVKRARFLSLLPYIEE